MTTNYMVVSSTDESGDKRWFVTDGRADWIAGPYSTREQAEERAQLARQEANEEEQG